MATSPNPERVPQPGYEHALWASDNQDTDPILITPYMITMTQKEGGREAGSGSRVAQGSKALHLSARGITTDTLVQIQAVSQPAVTGSPIRRCITGPVSSGFGRCGLSL